MEEASLYTYANSDRGKHLRIVQRAFLASCRPGLFQLAGVSPLTGSIDIRLYRNHKKCEDCDAVLVSCLLLVRTHVCLRGGTQGD